MIFHELRVFNRTQHRHRSIAYYRTGGGDEIDFVIETRKRTPSQKPHLVCLEIKHARQWRREWEKPMRSLAASNVVVVDRMIGVYGGSEIHRFEGLDVLPVMDFLRQLSAGHIF